MQFIADGPEIPNVLLQAHEEGRVVFFCGAGISYPAGLPDFKGLVEQIYRRIGTVFTERERYAFDREQYDATLNLLEPRLPGDGRLAMRCELAKVLETGLGHKDAYDTHAALLHLACNPEDTLRLVTTNFDRMFHAAAKHTKQKLHAYTAPMLPIPKNSRWNGLVYLHGRLPEEPDDTALNRLVVTSGDFGLAYLTERWAARFVSELFRNYVVCFVGYSINDPVLRYMMDALAADRMLGEVTPQAWALGDCEPGQEHRKTIEWEAKGVTPILYEVPAGSHDHSALYQTLHAWADTYCDDIQGKERIVDNYALKNPSDSTPQNDFVGRMLWALSDKSGLPAKRFADFNPVPSLDWLLEAFSDEHFQHSDLARWLRRYLNDPRLIIWIAQREGPLPSQWVLKTREALHEFASLERDGKTAVLDEIRSRSPKAIPGPLMRTLWRLLLSGRVKSSGRDSDPNSDLCSNLKRWKEDLKQEGVTATLRWELREMLAPQVVLKKPLFRDNEAENIDEPTQISQLMDWELALTTDHLHLALHEIADEHWTSALPLLLEDFQQLLRDALDLLRELGEADDRKDQSYIALPAINSDQQDPEPSWWVSLIKLLCDAWLAVFDVDSARATRIAQSWFELPYPTFKRLALFAASQDDCIAPEQWVEWLLADDSWWLWPMETGREVSRLLVRQGRQLTPASQARLEKAILRGPPRRKCRDDLDPDKELIAYLVGYPIKLNLAALEKSGLVLNAAAQTRLAELSTVYAKPGDYEELWESILPPRTRRDLVPWLKKSLRFPSYSEDALREFAQGSTNLLPSYEEGWREVCRNRFFHSLFALCDLARDGVWPTERWHEALHAWSEEDMLQRSWCYAAPLVQRMPDTVIQEIAHGVTGWIEVVSRTINRHKDILLDLCRRVLEMPLEADTGMTHNGGPTDQPVAEALNHPIGHVTQALINLWFKRNPNDNDLLPEEIKPFFTELCDVQKARFRPGRVPLGSQLIAFFRVDRAWTEQYLLPLFNWDNPTEAKAVWEGFLRSPRLYQPLLTVFKAPFLESAEHYTDLGGRYKQRFAAFLTYAALEPTEGYTMDEFRSAMGALPQDGIEASAQALFQALEGSADRREDYWKNRVQPFWQQAWPKSRDLVTPRLAERLTLMSIAARGEFPAALAAVKDWLQPLEHPHYVVDMLHKSGLCRQYPGEALYVLAAVISDQPGVTEALGRCLDEIRKVEPGLVKNAGYTQLQEYLRIRKSQ